MAGHLTSSAHPSGPSPSPTQPSAPPQYDAQLGFVGIAIVPYLLVHLHQPKLVAVVGVKDLMIPRLLRQVPALHPKVRPPCECAGLAQHCLHTHTFSQVSRFLQNFRNAIWRVENCTKGGKGSYDVLTY